MKFLSGLEKLEIVNELNPNAVILIFKEISFKYEINDIIYWVSPSPVLN